MTEHDYGRPQIATFTEAAKAGQFTFDPTAVAAAVTLYDTMIRDLYAVRSQFEQAANASGFGGFPSAQALQRGFATKATDGLGVVAQLVDAAMQMQEGLLRAANQVTEADAIHARRITLLEQAVDREAGR